MDEKKQNQIKKTNEVTNPTTNGNEIINPSDIEGKIEIKDTRERQDGPGGN